MISLRQVTEEYGIQRRRIDRLISVGKLETLVNNRKTVCVTENSLNKYLNELKEFSDEYIYFKEVFDKLGIHFNTIFYKYIANYDELNIDFDQDEQQFMKPIEIRENYFEQADRVYYFKRKHFETLQRDYVNLNEAQQISGIKDGSAFFKWLKIRTGIKVFSFSSTAKHMRFVRRDKLEQHKFIKRTFNRRDIRRNPISHKDFFTQRETLDILRLSISNLRSLEKQGLLSPSDTQNRNVKYFSKHDVTELVEKQQKELSKMRSRYYSLNEVRKKYSEISSDALNKAGAIKRVPLPAYLAPFYHDESNKNIGRWLYEKNDVEIFLQQYLIKEKLYEASYLDPMSEYRRRLSILAIAFLKATPITEQLWFTYVEEYLNRDGIQYATTINYIHMLISTAKALTQVLTKEIYQYTSNELNLLLLNNGEINKRKVREHLYHFLLFVDKLLRMKNNKSPFAVERLLNPRQLPRTNMEKKVFTVEEYSTLFRYCRDTSMHQQKAVRDVLEFVKSDFKYKNYKCYDSTWLYVTLHLNNAWRHSDCMTVPRISLEGTYISGLDWFLYNELSDEDVKKIMFRIKAAPMIVSKTKAERNFYCAPELERSVATAIAICELRTRLHDHNSNTIVYGISDKNNRKLKKTPHNNFFIDFPLRDFVFANRAMNRTLISLVTYVQSMSGNSSDSEYLKMLRNHVDIETTDIYIQIPQERMDEISLQLFDRDFFGHIPNVLAEIVFGSTTNEFQRTEQIKQARNSFGDIYKVEETAGFLNDMLSVQTKASQAFINAESEYKDVVEQIIRDLPLDEAKSLFHRAITGQMPSKKKHYQCIVSETNCKFPGRDCESCPLSIPHFYAISSLVERIFQKVNVIQQSSDSELTEAEMTRQANWLALDLDLLKYAQQKYGKYEIASFATGLNEKLKLINSFRQYQTIGGK